MNPLISYPSWLLKPHWTLRPWHWLHVHTWAEQCTTWWHPPPAWPTPDETVPDVAPCYITVGTFTWCGFGSKQWHYGVGVGVLGSVCEYWVQENSGSCWWEVDKLLVTKDVNENIFERNSCREEWGSEFYCLLLQVQWVQQKKSSLGLQGTQQAWLKYSKEQ